MTRRSRAPLLLFGCWLAFAGGSIVLAWTNRPFTFDLRSLDSSDFAYVAASAIYTLAFAIVGAVVAARTRNPVGWLLIVVAIGWTMPLLLEQYSLRALALAPGSLPAGRWVAAAAPWTLLAIVPTLALVLLLFPTGTPRSSRWRPFVVAAPVAGLLLAVSVALQPGPIESNLPRGIVVTNPLGVTGAAALLPPMITIAAVASVCLALAGVVSLVLRFRASHGIERQQVKWLVLVCLATVLVLAVYSVVGRLTNDPALDNAIDSIGWGVLVTTVMLGMPLAIGAAILRYRLYDIDRIVSRTVGYAIVTAALLAAYSGLVVLFQRALGPLTGSSDFAVAASTLIVAAAFVPVRRRVQSAIDRRFNRGRYDAERTIEAFTAHLRDEVDIDALAHELAQVVERTMQPSHVSIWMRAR